jgi:hypothetical protein
VTSPADPRSQHSTDLLIRELIATRRPATQEEVATIIERMATAPFNPQMVRVPIQLRGNVFQGAPLASREPSIRFHLHKRIDERQWAPLTGPSEYLGDIRRVALGRDTRIAAYLRQGGPIVLSLGSTVQAVPVERRGDRWRPWLAVIYSADRGTLISGYQASALSELAMPEDVQWLK